jgi:glycosyltransferase involved in cell wall biosynthesis
MSDVVVNTRNLANPITGVQRYTLELVSRFSDRVIRISPAGKCEGLRGHMWEQFALPGHLGKKLLWSPSNTGPLAIAKQVVTIHDMVTLDHPAWMSRKFAAWYGWLLPRLVRRVARVITDSEFTRERILAITHIAAEKVAVIPLGVDRRFYPRTPEEIAHVREILGIPHGRYCLSVSAVEPRKNLRRLLQAWGKLQCRLPEDVWLVLAGGKGKSLVFQDDKWGTLPPRVHWTSHVADSYLPALYSGATAFIYVSLYEGFGLPPLEAMACGVPVVASCIPPLREVCGSFAILVDPLDVVAIAQGICQVIHDRDNEKPLPAALARAANFSWERTAELTWRVLEEAM